MIVVVTGGAASGKSAFAERLALTLPGPHAYVATMRHGDGETKARIARHRAMRAGKGFRTFELADAPCSGLFEPLHPDGGGWPADVRQTFSMDDSLMPAQAVDPLPPGKAALHCHADGASSRGRCRTALLEDLGNLVANGLEDRLDEVLAFPNVVIVANEVGCDGMRYDDFTMGYIRTLGSLACGLAAQADAVVEVVAGVPNVVKGALPWAC